MELPQVSRMAKAGALLPPGQAQPRRTAQTPGQEEWRCQQPLIVAAARSPVAESAAPDRVSDQTDRRNTAAVSRLALARSRHRRPPEVRETRVGPVRGQTSAPASESLCGKAPTAAGTNARSRISHTSS